MLKPLAVSESREAPRCQAMPDMSVIICRCSHCLNRGAVAGLVGIRVGVVSGVINLESSGVEASDWRLRHDQAYHEA